MPSPSPAMNYSSDMFLSYKYWLLKMASVYLPYNSEDWEDLAQEGHIAMWKASRTYDPAKGALPAWLTGAARLRMKEVARRKTWTGTPMIRGHVREAPALPVEPASEILDQAFVMQDSIEMAYHRGEIYEALAGLTPSVREALFNRFWLDRSVATGLYFRAIPKLIDNLSHLRGNCE